MVASRPEDARPERAGSEGARPEGEGGASSGRWFIAGFAGAVLLTAILLPVFNVLVDPYHVFHSWTVAGFNREKTERLTRGGRLTKSLDLRDEQFEAVLMGSSRVLLGMDPDASALDGQHAYNAGLGGTNMYELASVLDFIAQHQPNLELLVLGLDFSMFNRNRTVNGDYAVSGFAGRSGWQL
jgi:hypothetical protein